jgi:hypothetical protein
MIEEEIEGYNLQNNDNDNNDDNGDNDNDGDEIFIDYDALRRENELLRTDKEKQLEEESIVVDNATNAPLIVNDLKTMYDQNSMRTRKRSEQIKKRKENLHSSRIDTNEDDLNDLDILNNENKNIAEIQTIINNYDGKQRSSVIPYFKRFKEEDNEDRLRQINKKSIKEEKIIENNINIDENNPEIVYSDLECDFNDENNPSSSSHLTMMNTNNKSFVPISNNLISNAVRENATPSYLMALNQYYEEAASNNNYKNINSHSDQKRISTVKIINI